MNDKTEEMWQEEAVVYFRAQLNMDDAKFQQVLALYQSQLLCSVKFKGMF